MSNILVNNFSSPKRKRSGQLDSSKRNNYQRPFPHEPTMEEEDPDVLYNEDNVNLSAPDINILDIQSDTNCSSPSSSQRRARLTHNGDDVTSTALHDTSMDSTYCSTISPQSSPASFIRDQMSGDDDIGGFDNDVGKVITRTLFHENLDENEEANEEEKRDRIRGDPSELRISNDSDTFINDANKGNSETFPFHTRKYLSDDNDLANRYFLSNYSTQRVDNAFVFSPLRVPSVATRWQHDEQGPEHPLIVGDYGDYDGVAGRMSTLHVGR